MDDLRRLRAFIAVCDHGTVTAAAETLLIAQPAVSRQIQALEREVEAPLFERSGPRLRLTPAGRYLLPTARRLIAQSDRLTMAAQEVSGGEPARLTIAVAPATLSEVLAPFIADLGSRAPYMTVESVGGNRVHAAVIDRCDFGISADATPTHDLEWLALGSVPLRAYVSQRHPWARAGRREIDIAEVVAEHLILPPSEDPTRVVFDAAVTRAGSRYEDHTDLPFARIAQATASAGHGVGIATDLPRFGAHPLFVCGSPGTPIELSIHACWPLNHFASATLESVASSLAEFTHRVIEPAAWSLAGSPTEAPVEAPDREQ